jgi:phosphoglucosamine mutase
MPSKNIFGTDGIRTQVGTGILQDERLKKLGDALGIWLEERYGRNPVVLIAHDTRLSSGFVKSSLKSRLLLHPVQLYDAQVMPTPALFQLMHDDNRFDCGIMISASHNHYKDNGIKIIDARQGKLTLEDEERISELFYSPSTPSRYDALGSEQFWPEADTRYSESMIDYFPENFLEGKKIVLDCAHGAAYKVAPALFDHFGAEVVVINNQPNGININKQCGAVHTDQLQKVVIEQNADCGFAFDGDADRVMAVNRFGQLKNGDDIIALLLTHPLYQREPIVVGTIMSNKGFEQHIINQGKELLRTKVGDKYVSAALKEKRLLLGGESSGHIICGDYLTTGDGIFAALRCAEAIILTDNWDIKTFVRYPQVMINVAVSQKKSLSEEPLQSLIAASEKTLHKGRILVRYSGTEPLLRVMVEDDDFDHAQVVCEKLSKALQTVL